MNFAKKHVLYKASHEWLFTLPADYRGIWGLAIIKQLNLILPQSHLGSNTLRPSDPDTRHYLQNFAHVQKAKLKV